MARDSNKQEFSFRRVKERKLADIQDETREIVGSRQQRPEAQSEAEKEVKS